MIHSYEVSPLLAGSILLSNDAILMRYNDMVQNIATFIMYNTIGCHVEDKSGTALVSVPPGSPMGSCSL